MFCIYYPYCNFFIPWWLNCNKAQDVPDVQNFYKQTPNIDTFGIEGGFSKLNFLAKMLLFRNCTYFLGLYEGHKCIVRGIIKIWLARIKILTKEKLWKPINYRNRAVLILVLRLWVSVSNWAWFSQNHNHCYWLFTHLWLMKLFDLWINQEALSLRIS